MSPGRLSPERSWGASVGRYEPAGEGAARAGARAAGVGSAASAPRPRVTIWTAADSSGRVLVRRRVDDDPHIWRVSLRSESGPADPALQHRPRAPKPQTLAGDDDGPRFLVNGGHEVEGHAVPDGVLPALAGERVPDRGQEG